MSTAPRINPGWIALYHFRNRDLDKCLELCDEMLANNIQDQAAWYLKTRVLTQKAYLDDTDLEEDLPPDSVDENFASSLPRPGTSLRRPNSTATAMKNPSSIFESSQSIGKSQNASLQYQQSQVNQSVRPMSGRSRPMTGFARPSTMQARGRTGTALRLLTANNMSLQSSSGRTLRLGTATSLIPEAGGPFIDIHKLDLQRYSKRQELARVLFEYMLYQLSHPRKALELASAALVATENKDWWWKVAVAKCYYRMGMYRDAERFLKSSLKDLNSPTTYLYLVKIQARLDQPTSTISLLTPLLAKDSGSTLKTSVSLHLALARTHEALLNYESSSLCFKRALTLDPSNVEALSSLPTTLFYDQHPELCIKYYKRLLQFGFTKSAELWNNLGLVTFYAGQYDLCLPLFRKALECCVDEDVTSDVWYNIGLVYLNLGDNDVSYRCFRIAVMVNQSNSEAWTNLGVVEEMLYKDVEAALNCFSMSRQVGEIYEACFNMGLLAYRRGDIETAFEASSRSLDIYPKHEGSREILLKCQQTLGGR